MTTDSDKGRVVLVDMDGVLADFDGAVLDGLPPEIERVARTNFYIAKDYPEHKARVAEVYNHPEFFYRLLPIDGAIDGWERLLALGFEPRVCTAPLTLNPLSREGKMAWLEEHLVPRFGPDVLKRAIFDKNKFAYDASVLIDDRPDVDTDSGRASWRHVVFDQPYNQQRASNFRIRGWTDPNLPHVLNSAVRWKDPS